MVLARIMDDIILAGEETEIEIFLQRFNDLFKLGSIVTRPGHMQVLVLHIFEHDDYSIEVNADDKLSDIFEYSIFRKRRKQCGELFNDIEKKAFLSSNSTLHWIGRAASPFCFSIAVFCNKKRIKLK